MVAPKRCLLPSDFSVADIADPDLCECHPLLIAAAPAMTASGSTWPACPKGARNGPPLRGALGVSTICAALSNNSPTTCRLYSFGPCVKHHHYHSHHLHSSYLLHYLHRSYLLHHLWYLSCKRHNSQCMYL